MNTIASALESFDKVIAADPQKARAKGAAASARLMEGLKFEVTGPRGEKMHTDMPPAMGGTASAPNPGWYFRGAMASCAATVIAMRAARQGVALKLLEVTVESDSDHRGLLGTDSGIRAGFSAMRMKVKIGANGVDAAKLRALVEWGDTHSPVGCTVRESPPISIDVEVA